MYPKKVRHIQKKNNAGLQWNVAIICLPEALPCRSADRRLLRTRNTQS